MRALLSILFSVTAGAILAAAQTPPPIVIEHVRVFDGNRVIPNSSVVVEAGAIRSVGASIPRPKDAQVIDGTGSTLLPGLIDAHTHTPAESGLEQALIFGVTTDLDMFTRPDLAASIRNRQRDGGLLHYADLRSSGFLATAPGGHGTEYGVKVPTLTSPEEAQAWVDARIAEGADYIKAVLDDALVYGRNNPIPTLSKATLTALASAAHKRGKLIVVHIGTLQDALAAIDAGADGLAHLFVGPASSDEFARAAAAHHIFVIPTLTVLNTICATPFDSELASDARLKPFLPPAAITSMTAGFNLTVKGGCEGASQAIRQMKAAHLPILAGTDAGNPGTTQGASIHGEMELLVRAGLTPVEALHAATAEPAATFHLDDRGQIVPGKRADLVLVKGDPTVDIRATRDITAVWKAGHAVDRAAWKIAVAKQVEEQVKRKTSAPPAGSETGWISDFDGSSNPLQSRFGTGWALTTDRISGGQSVSKMEVVSGGADGTKGALLVTGEIKNGFAFPWAGVVFSPGAAPMAPANLSGRKAIRFWAKGDGGTYQLMLFSQALGVRPATTYFVAPPEWKEFVVPFASFGAIDGGDIMGIAWAAGPKAGTFTLWLDGIRLQ